MKIPNVLIIIVTYNRADVTCLMLKSLYEIKTEVAFEVIIIDNLSERKERDQIQSTFEKLLLEKNRRGKFVANSTNAGYSAGNNIGLKYGFENADCYTHLCLLNNDTIVSDYWLDRLLQHSLTGLIGPVSNSVGNEQRVPAFYETTGSQEQVKEAAYTYSRQWYALHQGSVAKTWMLGFFCVFGALDIFQKIGLLDENFGIGTYEDDDYCCRARALNIDLWIARDVFIHHWGSASFSKLNQVFFHTLMKKNRAYYEKKNSAPWKHPATTTFEAYRNELLWAQNHPAPLIQQCLGNYELTLKHQINYGNDWYYRIRTEPLWATLDAWVSANFVASKYRKISTLGLAWALSFFDRSWGFREKNQHWIKRLKELLHEN